MRIQGRRVIIAAAVLMTQSLAALAVDGIAVEAVIDREEVSIGDDVRYTVSVVVPSDYTVSLAEPGEAFTGFAVRDFGSEHKRDFFTKRTKWSWWYELDTYTAGDYTIGAVSLTLSGGGEERTVSAEPVKLKVKSLLDSERAEDLRDIRGPIAAKNRIGLLLAGLGILAGLLALAWRISAGRTITREEVAVPAWQTALERLRGLREADLPGQGRMKDYYSELSDIVRHYIEDRFDIHAAEMTTEEFLGHVGERRLLVDEHTRLLKEFLVAADMVKFAQYGPGPDEVEQSYTAAERFINETADRPSESSVVTDDL
jgi:hypothetical protein